MTYKTVDSKTVKRGEELNIRFISDPHRGEEAFDKVMFNKALKDAANKERRLVFLGDMFTSIPADDPRFSVEEHAETKADQEQWYRDLLREYKDALERVHVGNHEGKRIGKDGNFVLNACEEYGIEYGGFQKNMLYKSNGNTFTLYTAHGSKTARYTAGEGRRKKVNYEVWLKNYLRPICWSNLSVVGHIHRGILSTPHYERMLVNTGGKEYKECYLPDDDGRMYAACPSFLRIYRSGKENYGSRALFPPTGVGFVDLDLDKKLNIVDMRLVVSEGKKWIVEDSLKKRVERTVY